MRTPTLFLLLAAACSSGPPPRAPGSGETVPANSLDRSKLDAPPPDEPTRSDAAEEPGPPVPVPTKVEAPAEPTATKGGKGQVSKADCARVMDRYLELELASNPALAGLPPDVVAQAKEQMRAQHGEAPCTATAAQYRCGMAAKTTAAWQKCMK